MDCQGVEGSWSLPYVGVCFNGSWGRNLGAFKGPWEGLFRAFFRIVFSSIFEPWAHLETVSFHIVFLVFWANVVSSSESHLHSLHDCFFESLKTQILISLVFNRIFEPWSPLETISYPDFFQFCYANVISWLAFGLVYLWEHKTRKRRFRNVF